MNILIIGFGEIGKSISELYGKTTDNLFMIDYNLKNRIYYLNGGKQVINLGHTIEAKSSGVTGSYTIPVIKGNLDILHICIPYGATFIHTVADYINKYKPKLTIINSTIDIGATMDVFRNTDGGLLVHSPVMGKHPNLKESILTFKKIIGGVNIESSKVAEEHFKNLGVETETYNTPEESEVAKLLSTTYFAWNIIFVKQVNELCKKYGLDFENVYTKTNKIYNEGYSAFGDFQFVRPILKPMKGEIGGHCLIPNMGILENKFILAKIGLMYNNKFKEEK